MTILIIEDDSFWRLKLQMALELLPGIECIFAESIEEGLRQYESIKPAILVCDVVFPDGIIFNKITKFRACS